MSCSEEAVGIARWANCCAGFTAILKQRYCCGQLARHAGHLASRTRLFLFCSCGRRYSDFQVNEVDKGGSVIRLLASQIPATTVGNTSSTVYLNNGSSTKQDTVQKGETVHKEAEELPASHTQIDFSDHLAALEQVAGETNTATVRSFLEAIVAFEQRQSGTSQDAPKSVAIDVSTLNKSQRGIIHGIFKRPELPRLQTDSLTAVGDKARSQGQGSGVPAIRITYLPQTARKRKRDREAPRYGNTPWQGGACHHLRFVMVKENIDSHAALMLLSRLLHAPSSAFAVAGTKDKRAVTVQQVTAHKVAPERLQALNATLRGIKLGDFEYVDAPLFLGAAKGNRFDIILRAASSPEGAPGIVRAAQALQASGFINYFGLQRFGSGCVPTHRIGALLLTGQWQDAVNTLLAPDEGSSDDNAGARRLYVDHGDVAGALKALPRHLTAERALLEGLLDQKARQPAGAKPDMVAVLARIPRNLRGMYVHAYQSWLWNAAASARVAAHGLAQPVAGDLVLPVHASGSDDAAGAADAGREDVQQGLKDFPQPHVVTEDDVSAGRYSIMEVVLPQPGRYMTYPTHDAAQVYHRLCASDGLSLNDPPSHGVREYSLLALPGAYRRLVIRPQDLAWQLLRYREADAPLAVTDLDRAVSGSTDELTDACTVVQAEDTSEGELLALRIQVTLPSSTYATMLIRELTKQSTATAIHKARTLAAQPESLAAENEQSKSGAA